ncbi:MAG: hypothetical protein ABJF23_33505 [Bryobacteraceae bacterium]
MRGYAVPGLLLLQPAFGEYAEVHGLKMYYEVHGKGRPVVLLHQTTERYLGTRQNLAQAVNDNLGIVL